MNEIGQQLLHHFETPFKDSVLIFSLILSIILLAPVILRWLRIPGIIGLIISGTIIGPHGLFLIERNSAVNLFSTIGLLYIMFIAGLELDLGEFRKNRNKSIVFGILTFLLPFSIGFPVCYYFLGYGMKTSMLTASMFATHTLISYPIVSRLGIAKNEAVAVAVGGTIFTDTAVLIILSIISGSSGGTLAHLIWLRLGISLLIFTLIVIFVVPIISSWFFKRLEDEKSAHFVFVLFMVFSCAFIAQLAGLEPIIGAFAAGLALNRLIPHTSPLMNRVEFVGNSLFIPFFLISVGMLIDLRVLTTGPQALTVAAVLTTVALAGKWLAARFTASIFKYAKAQRKLIFGLSSAHAAATLAVILVGFNLGLVDDNILNGTIVLILITCLVASFVTENAGKKIALQFNPEESQSTSKVGQRILVPISNPATMERLIDFAMMIKDGKNKSPIIGLAIVDDGENAQARILVARKMLEKAIPQAASANQEIEIMATIDQNITNGIKRVSLEKFVTEIVMGWPAKTNLTDFLFGKTFDSVVNQTNQCIYITRFTLPLNVHTGLHLLCPQLIEKEPRFHSWLNTLLRMTSRLSLKITVHSTTETKASISDFIEQNKIAASVYFRLCSDINNLSDWKDALRKNDLIVLASARKGTLSHLPYLNLFPNKIAKQFPDNSLIFIYPEIDSDEAIFSFTNETDSGLIERSLGLLRGAKDIFKKK